ncbi:MAG TPA: glycine--tRNA ligase [Gemmataceae bacterium]|jgi:glycyl-tRNA synthetase|nr:glycine--tRNA ligase [Gemmataceae bacterium]
MAAKLDMEKLVSLCRRRGFIFQSSEIYGGINGFWDYGPLGVELKKNIKDAWWQDMVRNPPPGPDGQEITMVGLDCSIIMNPKVWEASGHVGGFSDPMVDCINCKRRYRADKVYFLRFKSSERTIKNTLYATEADNKSDAEVRLESEVKKRKIPSLLDLFQKREFDLISAADAPPSEDFYSNNPDRDKSFGGHCPDCGGDLLAPRAFNLMFESHAGALQSDENKVYLRPETAQGIFVNFRNVLDSNRVKLPFGIAQIGKAFRNEINPRNYIFRSREFEQMEIEFFCNPNESMKWYGYWRDLRKKWYSTLGIKSDNLKPREQGKEELAHYSIGTTDIEYMFPFSEEPQELEGVAHRGAFDLTAHMTKSGKDLSYFDEEAWTRDAAGRTTNSFKEWLKTNPPKEQIEKYQYTPHVIEPSAGADRFTLAVLCEAYHEDKQPDAKGNMEERLVMKFHPRLAPVKAAIFPLVKKDGMPEKAQALYRELKKHFKVEYDDAGAVGRRYRRQDEIGTPFCITIDGDTLKDDTVTIRDRDTLQQRRIASKDVLSEIRKALE